MLKRVEQFIRGMFARLSGKDYTFLTDYLTKPELDLFLTMSRYDQKHAVDVGRYLADGGESLELVRAGLLHDIGKADCPELTLIRRSIAVFLEWRAPDDANLLAEKGRGKLASAVYVHKNHPELGARILEEMGGDSRIITLVRYHQSGGAPADAARDLARLHEADEKF
jgi:putative nucleotidyltransferase with HDIG domain